MTPQIDALITEHGKVNFLVAFEDFEGMDLHAVWDDFVLGIKHIRDIGQVVVVGDKKWE